MLLLLLLSRFSHVWLCDPIDGSPPGSSVPGILQARTLEWVVISFSSAWKWKVKVKSLSRVWPSATPWTAAFQAPPSMGFSRQEYWSGVPLPSPTNRRDDLNYTDMSVSSVSPPWLFSKSLVQAKMFLLRVSLSPCAYCYLIHWLKRSLHLCLPQRTSRSRTTLISFHASTYVSRQHCRRCLGGA